MKTNKIVFATLAIGLFWLASCKKTDTTNHTADPNAKQHNEDVSNTKNESDNVNTDVNNALNNISGFSGKTDGVQALSICGATIDSTHQHDAVKPYIVITFDGITPCGSPSRIRSGEVKVELINGTKWSQQGAKLKITHTDYKVIYVNLNNHYLTFNGVKYLTNVDGFDWISYWFSGGSLTARIKERTYDMTVKFENDSTDSWNSARLTTWSVTNYTTFAATVNGDTTINGKTIDSWGTTRFGTSFITEMISPWKSGTTCGWWKPTEGKYMSSTSNFSVTATFGVNEDGSSHGSGCGAYGIKLEWNYNSGQATGNAVIPYF